MSSRVRSGCAALFAAIAAVAACHDDGTPRPSATVADLQDPNTCASCHASQVEEWRGSMHAYAAEDPIFLAMQKRAQRETNGQIGTLCAGCHAPIAVREGLTTDGLNLASLPAQKRGVTCYFCHSATDTTDSHNNAITLSDDLVLRGDIRDPKANAFHASTYSTLHDGDDLHASALCGTCHDVVNPAGVPVESSFAEWQKSLFSHDVAGQKLTCQGCHMPGHDAPIAQGGPPRRAHDHTMPAVDVAVIPFAQAESQASEVQSNLDPALVAKMCVRPPQQGDTVEVTLDNAFVGHNFPSGAAHDRRVWLELIGYQADKIVYQSGVFADGQEISAAKDPSLWLFADTLYDKDKKVVPFLWQAASQEVVALPFAVTSDPKDPAFYHAKVRTFPVPANADRITMRVRIVAFGPEILADLVKSGDLDPAIAKKVVPLSLGGTTLEWKTALGYKCVP